MSRYVVGLTGGIGSGKTAVSDGFAKLGAEVVDTDLLAHRLSEAGQPGALAVAQQFGVDFLRAGGAIDRVKLRQLVFGNPDAKRRLEEIFHPLINQLARANLAASRKPYQILVVPLLFETNGYQDIVQQTLVVDCPEIMQKQRVMLRSGWSEAEVEQVMAQQLDRQGRLARADDVLSNEGDLPGLMRQVEKLHLKYLQLAELNEKTI